jgi:hypothetical protein
MQFAVVTLLVALVAQSAAAADVAPEQVDQIFSAYNKAGSPGCALGVTRDGRFAYRRSYGLGSLAIGAIFSSQAW